MKKYLFLLLILLLTTNVYADSKVSDLDAITSPATGDYTYVVNDDDTSSKKVTIGNLLGVATDLNTSGEVTGGDADTATALGANPDDCPANQFADAIDAEGDLTCNGVVDADVANDITITSTGTVEGATITEGGNAVYNSTETPSGELGGTYANITVDSSIHDDEYIELGDSFVGDVTGAYDATVVGDDTHLHHTESMGNMTSTTFAGIITDETGSASLVFQNGATMTSLTVGTALTIAEGIITDGKIIGADIKDDTVVLTTDTAGNYVASVTDGIGISGGDGGSEAAGLTLVATLGTSIDHSEIVIMDSTQFAAWIANETGTGSVVLQDTATMTGLIVDTLDTGQGANELYDLPLASGADADSSTTDSDSGMEIVSTGLTLLRGCDDNEILKWDESADDWNCEADTGGGGNSYETWFGGNGGITTADSANDEMTVTGQTGITVTVSSDTTTIGHTGVFTGTDQSTFTEGVIINDGGGGDEDDDLIWESTSDAAALECDAGDDTCTFGADVVFSGSVTGAEGNLWATFFGGNGGLTTADSTADEVTVTGLSGITVTVTDNTITAGIADASITTTQLGADSVQASELDVSDVSDDIAGDIAAGEYADDTVQADDIDLSDFTCADLTTTDCGAVTSSGLVTATGVLVTTNIKTPTLYNDVDDLTIYSKSGSEVIINDLPIKIISVVDVDGVNNIFIGSSSGDANTEGDENLFIGTNAGKSNTQGEANVMLGYNAGEDNDTGSYNFFLGASAGKNNTEGENNIFIGQFVGSAATATDQDECTMIGKGVGLANTGDSHVMIGAFAGAANTTANGNTFIGQYSGGNNTDGGSHVMVGHSTGRYNVGGWNNTYIGYGAGRGAGSNSPTDNTFIGWSAGYAVTSGGDNTFLGKQAGEDITTGSRNVLLGHAAGESWMTDENDILVIDNTNTASPLIYGDFDGNALTINGTLHVTGNITSDASCCGVDYVFEEDYELMDLDNLDDFIKQNKHLPEVEIKPTVNLNEQLTLLLKKIEELTLYTIQQEKRIVELEEEK